MVMTKSHPIWLMMLTQILGNHMPNFGLVGLLISFWQTKQLSLGVAMTKTTPITTPTYANNAHPINWRTHAKFRSFRSECLSVMPRHTYVFTNQKCMIDCVNLSSTWATSAT